MKLAPAMAKFPAPFSTVREQTAILILDANGRRIAEVPFSTWHRDGRMREREAEEFAQWIIRMPELINANRSVARAMEFWIKRDSNNPG